MKFTSRILAMMLALALIICVMPATFAAGDGSIDSPDDNVNYDDIFTWGYHIEHLTTSADTYWYTIECDYDGVIDMSFVAYPDNGFAEDNTDLIIHVIDVKSDLETQFNNEDNGKGAPFTGALGDEFLIGIEAPANTFVVVEAIFTPDPIVIPGMSFYVCVEAGTTINYAQPMGMPLHGKGVTVEPVGTTDISKAKFTDMADYTDSDQDGVIELTAAGHPMMNNKVSFSITNSSDDYAIYKVTFGTDPQAECNHPKLAETTAVPEVPKSCHADGYASHKVCPDCGCLFNPDGTPATSESLVIPADNALIHDQGQQGDCTNPGILETWYCPVHNEYYSDAEGTQVVTDRVIVAPGHTIKHIPASDPTCEHVGYIDCYQCTSCYKYFSTEAAKDTDEIDPEKATILPDDDMAKRTHGDGLELVETITPAGCTTAGSGKYTCTCQAAGEAPFTMAIPATGHTLVNGVCSVCNHDENPKTGDMGIGLAAVVAMVSMGAVLVIGKKKEF